MIETIGIFAVIAFAIWIIIRIFKWLGEGITNPVKTNSSQKIQIEVTFPIPEKTNDYRFYKYVESEPVYKLEPTYKQMKKREIYIKPDFEQAIQTKIKEGEFINPLKFKDFFGIKFDLIGIHFLKGTDNPLSAFQIGLCYIQDGRVADIDAFDFSPPKKIIETKKFQKTLEVFDYDQEWVEMNSFKDVWEIFEIRDFLNHNLIVVWDNEVQILEKVLNNNGIEDYNLSVLRIKEIVQEYNLPDSIDTLLEHLDSDLTIKDDLSLVVCELATELKEKGINIESFIKIIKPAKHQSKSKNTAKLNNTNNDFIALDVETAIGKRWSICQIGISIVENGELKQTISELIQPPNNKYSQWNTKIHGITAEVTENKPFFPEIWEKIYPIIESKKIVAHNAAFDIDCLKQTLTYYGLSIPHFDYDCTLNLTGQNLEDACTSYHIDLNNHHDAGCDAEACAQLYLKVKNGAIPDLSKVKPKKQTRKPISFSGHERLVGDVLKPDLENADPNSPFYNKKVVFTGVLEKIERQEAAMIIKKMGADIDTGITKRTNYVITGTDPGPSKMNKIIQYNNDGCNIQILYENDFLKMIKNKHINN